MVVLSLLVICFSGVHAEPAAEPSEGVGQNRPEFGPWMLGLLNAFGPDAFNYTDSRNPGNNPFGIGMRDDLDGWNPGDNPFGIGMREDLDGWTPGDNPFGIGMRDDLDGWTPGDDIK